MPEETQQEPIRFVQLYYCPDCGYWTDKTLRDAIEKTSQDLSDGIIRAFGGTTPEREALPDLKCPKGHGDLVLVSSQDRISVIHEKINEAIEG